MKTHRIKHKQDNSISTAVNTPQDADFYDREVLRSISMALKVVGFEAAKPEALEAFRAEVEEFMLHFLGTIRQSMLASRRNAPLPQDFALALTNANLRSSTLMPQLQARVPPEVVLRSIPSPPPDDPPLPNLDAVLGLELSGAKDKADKDYIPIRFPSFPSKDTWRATPVYTKRETDARQIRERATQEGIMAEEALRELMAAAKRPKQNGQTSGLAQNRKRKAGQDLWKDAVESFASFEEESTQDASATILPRVQSGDSVEEMNFDSGFDVDNEQLDEPLKAPVQQEQMEPIKKREDSTSLDGPMFVNYERKYWRRSAQSTSLT
jgi:transcription initiation factor TFIID subunit 8